MIYLHHKPMSAIVPDDMLPAQKRQEIGKYRHQILNAFCQTRNLPIPIYDKSIHGKPFVKNIPDLHFNQSHCPSDYVLIYSLVIPNIGVDVEHIHRRVDFDKFAKRYFHADEYQYWHDGGCDGVWWFKLWTIKEAVLKASGLGIRLPLNQIKAVFVDKDGGYVTHDDIGRFYFKNLMMGDCVVTVAYPFEFGRIVIAPFY